MNLTEKEWEGILAGQALPGDKKVGESVAGYIARITASTPAAHWRTEGEPDPHGDRYNCERVKLTKGELTDDQLANEFYLYDHRNGLSSMFWLQAAKDRIRWLSRALVKASQTHENGEW